MTRVTSCLAFALVPLAVACGPVKRPDGGQGLLPVGADAPEVVGVDGASHEVRLSALKGHAVVVYFYPQDGTPGCTKEACAFRDAWTRLEKADVQVIGVSTNSPESHAKFQKEHNLTFPLASDDGKVAGAYGVKKNLWGFERVSFLVDREGKVRHVWPSVDPAVHADEVVAEASKL